MMGKKNCRLLGDIAVFGVFGTYVHILARPAENPLPAVPAGCNHTFPIPGFFVTYVAMRILYRDDLMLTYYPQKWNRVLVETDIPVLASGHNRHRMRR